MAKASIYRNTIQSKTPTLDQLAEARPHRPAYSADDFASDTRRVLAELESAGALGRTTRELMDHGCGLRPPNRIADLRKRGIAITTRGEPGRVYRFILTKYLSPKPKPPEPAWEDKPRLTGLPLFDLAARQ